MTYKVIFIPNKAGIDWTLKNPNGTVGRYMRAGANKVQAAARAQAGMSTGALRASIGVTQERAAYGQILTIGSSLSHALPHHEGTAPHRITGRNGGMLRFAQSGRIVYHRSVMHPGTRPNRYLADNLMLVFTPSLNQGVFY